MTKRLFVPYLLASCCMLAACHSEPAVNNEAAPADNAAPVTNEASAASDPIASAESAAPANISEGATIVSMGADGTMTTLREGTNGWTCMPDSPTTPGDDPMCMDANAAKWAEAWMTHKTPPADTVGLMYMLKGGTDASNIDPYATAPTEGGDWIKTGPHLMVVGSPSLNSSYKGDANPDTTLPYVMWADTPYAHLMIPTG